MIPPSQRSKARYHNLDILVDWGLKVLQYWLKQDFSLISSELVIDEETLLILREKLDKNSLDELAKLLGTKASDFTSFSELLEDKIGQKISQKEHLIISQAAQVGRRKFLEKLGWLLTYEKELHVTCQILKVFYLAKQQLNQQGLNHYSRQEWLNKKADFSDSLPIQSAQQKVTQYLTLEGQKVPCNQSFLATSDIIESIFGKYKIFSDFSPSSEINDLILTLLLSTTELTPDLVLQAMETVQIADVTALVKICLWSIYAF